MPDDIIIQVVIEKPTLEEVEKPKEE